VNLKAFLLVFDAWFSPRQPILDFLNTRPEVKNWFAFLPAAIFIISDRSAHELSAVFRQHFLGRLFVVTEIPAGANNGWLNKNAWDFINNPKPSGRWP